MKILFFSGLERDKMSFYRGHGVLSYLHRLNSEVQITTLASTDNFNIMHCLGYDLALFHRPDTAAQVVAMKALKKLNIPVVVDIDDDLTTVPEYSSYHVLMKFKENDYIKHCCEALTLADKIIVSTEALKEQFSFFNKNIDIVPNAFNDYLYKPATSFNKDSKIVLWRGGHTHEQDLFLYQTQLEKLIQENTDFEFVFWGRCLPDWLKVMSVAKKQKNLTLRGVTDVFSYFFGLQELKPALTLVPLEFNQFNLGKSDIAAMETVTSGGLALCPDMPEWYWTSHKYKDQDSFYLEATLLLDEIRDGRSLTLGYDWAAQMEHIQNNRMLNLLNTRRLDILSEVAYGKKG